MTNQETHLGFLTLNHIQKKSRMKAIFSKLKEVERINTLTSFPIYMKRRKMEVSSNEGVSYLFDTK